MRNLAIVVLVGSLLIFGGVGCTMTWTPIAGNLVTLNLDSPLAVGDTADVSASKKGTATATGIVGFVMDGDCSLEAAMANGGITKIHHVDSNVTNILGVYATYTTIVWGE